MGWVQAGRPTRDLQFCLPSKLGIEPEQAIAMVKKFAEPMGRGFLDRYPFGAVLLMALKETFPCEKK